MKNKIEYFVLLSPLIFFMGYFVYHSKSISVDVIDNFLFGLFIPYTAMFLGVDVVSFIILAIITIMGFLTFLVRNWRYKFWVWSAIGWAYIYLCFWCVELIASV